MNALLASSLVLLASTLGAAPDEPSPAPPPASAPATAHTVTPARITTAASRLPASQLPEVVLLDKVPGCYGAVRFDHRGHVQMAPIANDCRACHHDLPEPADTVGPQRPRACRDCHDALSTVTKDDKPGLRGAYHRQCLSCHKDWSHENACGFCHTSSATARLSQPNQPHLAAPRAAPKPSYVYRTGHKGLPIVTFRHDDHSERFGLACAECHTGSSCGSCHGDKTERPAVNRQQTCYSCHSESRCVTCHAFGERERFDHGTRTRWFLRPGHASLTCDACHQNARTPEPPDPETCGDCHAKRYGGGLFDHARTGVTLSGDHSMYDCLDCHRGGNEGMLASCSACHTDRPTIGERRAGPDPNEPRPADRLP